MKNPLLLCVLFLSFVSVRAGEQVRARPVLKADKETNIVLLHVAQYFVMTIPDDHTIDELECAITCTFEIANNGSLRNLQISAAPVGVVDAVLEQTRRPAVWIQDGILEGMSHVPAFDASQLQQVRTGRKREVVFSFGKTGTGGTGGVGGVMGLDQDGIRANIDRSITAQIAALERIGTDAEQPGDRELVEATPEVLYHNRTPKWNAYTEENIKATTKEMLKRYPYGLPPALRNPTPTTPPVPPKTEITVTLQ